MKRLLFWKILVAFWITFLIIMQGVWLVFTITRDEPGPGERRTTAPPTFLLQAGAAVEDGGTDGFARFVADLPEDQRQSISLVPTGSGLPAPQGGPQRSVMLIATAPGGTRYAIDMRPSGPPRRGLPFFGSPPEMLFIGIAMGFVFAFVLARYLTDPIHKLRDGFHSLARGDLKARVSFRIGRRRDEIADLAHEFDFMAQRVEQLVRNRDELLHNVSHELRSPLARLQLATEMARKSPETIATSLHRIDREAARLDMLVGELLTLARTENVGPQPESYFDLAEVVRLVVEDARFSPGDYRATIALEEAIPSADERPPVRGEAELVRRALDNVLRNARRFAPPDGTVEVAVTYNPEAAQYEVAVRDDGPGIEDHLIERIFEPFQRADQSPDGTGLGLAIAERAVVACGGSIAAMNRPEGGLEVLVRLPAAPTVNGG